MADLYYAEREIESAVLRLLNSENASSINLDKIISSFDENYSDEQLEAIRVSYFEKILIITGGPGTGKTTTLKGIIQLYQTFDKKMDGETVVILPSNN